MEAVEIEAKFAQYVQDPSDWCQKVRDAASEYSSVCASVPGKTHLSAQSAVAADMAGKKRYVDPDMLSSSLRRLTRAVVMDAPQVQKLLASCDVDWKVLPEEEQRDLALSLHRVLKKQETEVAAGEEALLTAALAGAREVAAAAVAAYKEKVKEADASKRREEEKVNIEAVLRAASANDAAQLSSLLQAQPDLVQKASASLLPFSRILPAEHHIHGQHSALSLACERGAAACVTLLLKNRADIEKMVTYSNRRPSMSWQYTPLHLAVFRAGSVECVKVLLENKANVAAKASDLSDSEAGSEHQANALHMAARREGVEGEALLQTLLQDSRTMALLKDRDSRGNTPLHVASTAAAARCLLKAGASATEHNRAGNTPLQGVQRALAFDKDHLNGRRSDELTELVAVLKEASR
mmetsp:Transcript_36243/g.85035  ORF Transcript_36243/g.85035 Transcript_36243/m.85035 type:complete len:410 (+) Transcript_36243:179-1408(+)